MQFSVGKVGWSPTVSSSPSVGSMENDSLKRSPIACHAGRALCRVVQVNYERVRPQLDLDWLVEAYKLSSANRRSQAIDIVIDHLDDLLLEDRMRDVDAALAAVDVRQLRVPVLLALLSATFQAKQHLSSRAALVRRIEARLTRDVPAKVDLLLANLR